jgi:hypothetical protein
MSAFIAFTLPDLMLQGGQDGTHHYIGGAGAGAQLNLVFISHVIGQKTT